MRTGALSPAALKDRSAARGAPAARAGPRACLHATLILRDAAQTLVTPANLTEAAQEQNIEVGVFFDDQSFACGVVAQLDRLVAAGGLVQAAQ